MRCTFDLRLGCRTGCGRVARGVAPLAVGTRRQTEPFASAPLCAPKATGFYRVDLALMDLHEVQDVHASGGGRTIEPRISSACWMRCLSGLCRDRHGAGARTASLVAAQLDIMGTTIRHDYYSVSDTIAASGCGDRGARRVVDADSASAVSQTMYSFGRGSRTLQIPIRQRPSRTVRAEGLLRAGLSTPVLSENVIRS